MATLKEIANLCGVSRGTVDRVLNNRGCVKAETAKRVKETASSLNYQPNKAGLILAAQKKNIKIGVILFENNNPFFDELKLGILAKKEELSGYNCIIQIEQIPFKEEAQCKAIDYLEQQKINGIVLIPYNSSSIAERINRLYEKNIFVITTNTDIYSKRLAYVGSNYYIAGKTAAGLISRMTNGNVKLGIVTGSNQILCHTKRIAGFIDCVQTCYPNINIIEIAENNDNDETSYHITSALIKKYPFINTLFFAAGGVYGGCMAVLDANLAYKIKIFTFDIIPTTKQLIKQGIICATICQQPFVQGYQPLDILTKLLLEGVKPKQEFYYTSADIRIAENIESC